MDRHNVDLGGSSIPMNNLTVRLLFAFPGMLIFFGLMYFNYWTRVGALTFILVLGTWEYGRILMAKYPQVPLNLILPILMLLLNATQVLPGMSSYLPMVSVFSIFAIILWGFRAIDIQDLFPWIAKALFGFTLLGFWTAQGYRIIGEGSMSLEGAYPFLFTATVMWASDSFAYFAGRTLGKTKMAPQISPKKTWEGSAGGVLGAMVWGAFVGPAMTGLNMGALMGLIFVLSVAGQIGDLLFSALKRYTGVKDSSHIFPGHGGVLDRFDSLILGLPVTVVVIEFFK